MCTGVLELMHWMPAPVAIFLATLAVKVGHGKRQEAQEAKDTAFGRSINCGTKLESASFNLFGS